MKVHSRLIKFHLFKQGDQLLPAKGSTQLSNIHASFTLKIVLLFIFGTLLNSTAAIAAPNVPPELKPHLLGIASFAQVSPMASVPAGWFLMGTNRRDADAYNVDTQYDDTEFPQRRIWLDAFKVDQYEATLGKFLAFLNQHKRQVSDELQELIWHLIDVHFIPDQILAPWPALYVTWEEASAFCRAQGKRLPTEAEWEKAARGMNGLIFPWGRDEPEESIAVFGQYHMHQIPLVAAVDSYPESQSPFKAYHMAGNVAEWVQDWFGSDYYPIYA